MDGALLGFCNMKYLRVLLSFPPHPPHPFIGCESISELSLAVCHLYPFKEWRVEERQHGVSFLV